MDAATAACSAELPKPRAERGALPPPQIHSTAALPRICADDRGSGKLETLNSPDEPLVLIRVYQRSSAVRSFCPSPCPCVSVVRFCFWSRINGEGVSSEPP